MYNQVAWNSQYFQPALIWVPRFVWRLWSLRESINPLLQDLVLRTVELPPSAMCPDVRSRIESTSAFELTDFANFENSAPLTWSSCIIGREPSQACMTCVWLWLWFWWWWWPSSSICKRRPLLKPLPLWQPDVWRILRRSTSSPSASASGQELTWRLVSNLLKPTRQQLLRIDFFVYHVKRGGSIIHAEQKHLHQFFGDDVNLSPLRTSWCSWGNGLGAAITLLVHQGCYIALDKAWDVGHLRLHNAGGPGRSLCAMFIVSSLQMRFDAESSRWDAAISPSLQIVGSQSRITTHHTRPLPY